MKPLTEHEKAAGGNGDLRLYEEIEAERNRDPAEYRGIGDPDPKYDLAPMVEKQTFAEMVFLQKMEDLFDEWTKGNSDHDTDATQQAG